jgi:hypothetical protein
MCLASAMMPYFEAPVFLVIYALHGWRFEPRQDYLYVDSFIIFVLSFIVFFCDDVNGESCPISS